MQYAQRGYYGLLLVYETIISQHIYYALEVYQQVVA